MMTIDVKDVMDRSAVILSGILARGKQDTNQSWSAYIDQSAQEAVNLAYIIAQKVEKRAGLGIS